MKTNVGSKFRKGARVTLTEAFSTVPKGTQGKVISWTYERFWDGIYHTRHLVCLKVKDKEIEVSIPTKLLKK